jgi:hypothetical protein
MPFTVLRTVCSLANETAKEQTVRSAVDGKISTVSILNRIRKQLRLTAKDFNVFGFFIDTNSHVSNLFPPSENRLLLTPSMREPDLLMVPPELVLPLFCMLPHVQHDTQELPGA